MAHPAVRAVLLGLTLLTTYGCSEEPACTLIGGVEGLLIEVPPDTDRRGSTLLTEVCDAQGCVDVEKAVARHAPIEPGVWLQPGDLGQVGTRLSPGTVSVRAQLIERDGASTEWREDVRFGATYPNGPECDGDGYVQGTLRLEREDRTRFGIID